MKAFFPLIAVGILISIPKTCQAIPAFARKYNISCGSCHSPIPRLTPVGANFETEGFRLKGVQPADSLRETGDSKLMLMREVPLSFRFDGFAQYQPKNSPDADFQWPYLLKIISGGEITERISYYLYFIFNEAGSIGGVEDAFVHFANVADLGVDITAGQFQVVDPVFERELRPTFEDYAVYTARPGNSKTDLTYDRGITLRYELPSETDLVVSVVNGNGIGAADGRGNFDSDPFKNFFFRVAQSVGRAGRIGALGYIGKEGQNGITNKIYMMGPDVALSISKFSLEGGFVYRSDRNPYFLQEGSSKVATQGGFVQLAFQPGLELSDWYFFLLYNDLASDISDLKYRSIAGNVTYSLARNFKLMGEYGYDLVRERQRITLGFVTAF